MHAAVRLGSELLTLSLLPTRHRSCHGRLLAAGAPLRRYAWTGIVRWALRAFA